MANRTYDEMDDRFSQTGCYSVGNRKKYDPNIENLICPTSVGEQIRREGWTRVDTPACAEGVDLVPYPLQGGAANGSTRAAYPGTPNPTPGTTY